MYECGIKRKAVKPADQRMMMRLNSEGLGTRYAIFCVLNLAVAATSISIASQAGWGSCLLCISHSLFTGNAGA